MVGKNMSKFIERHKVSIKEVKYELPEFYNDEIYDADGKQLLKHANEYAYQRYGISAADIICGGDIKEFFAKWYDVKIGDIRRLIDEQAEKYDLTFIDQWS